MIMLKMRIHTIFFSLLLTILLVGDLAAADRCVVRTMWIDFVGSITPPTCNNPTNECGNTNRPNQMAWSCEGSCMNRGYGHPECHGTVTCCDDCGRDSINCSANAIWNSAECRCEDDYCLNYRNDCQSKGGRFEGNNNVIDQCCRGQCNLCGEAFKSRIYDKLAKLCCDNGAAPPMLDRACFGMSGAGNCGVSTSTLCANNSCHCIFPGEEGYNHQLLQCYPDQSSSSQGEGSSSSGAPGSSSGGGSSGGGGSSSSGGGSSGSGNGDDFEYDYNDSLHKIIVALGAIDEDLNNLILCFTMGQCKTDLTGVEDGISSIGDSLHGLKLLIADSSSKMIDLLKDIKGKSNGAIEITDGLVVLGDSLMNALREQNDSTGIYLDALADSVGVSRDSLLAHLDSIWKSLKPDVQDSILKYQKYAHDNFDSVLYGTGKGFGLIDQLIDSTVKYFTGVTAALETLSVEVGLDSGLFVSDTSINPTVRSIDTGMYRIDTALQNIYSEFVYFGDTYRVYMNGLSDSMGGFAGNLVGKLEDLGDSAGSVRGAIGGIGDSLEGWWSGTGKGGLDTSGSGVATAMDGVINGTSLDADSAAIGSIYNAGMNDPSLHYGPGGVFDTSRTGVAGDTVPDSAYGLPSLDSVKTILEQSVKKDYDSAETKYKAYFDTLRDEMQLIDWDSVILSPLAAKVPNTNTCPADCFAVTSTGAPSIFGSFTYNFGVCNSWPILGGMNVLLFVRLILRIVTAVLCVYIGAWFIAGRK